MPELPASVRLSLWVTQAWATGASLEKAIRLAMPDIDHVAGDLAQLGLWHDLGEQALLVALPAAGDLSRMPGASPEAHAAAAAGGECVYVPGLGGMLVPTVSWFGSGDSAGPDVGTRVDWTAYQADPVPRHRVEALDASQLERHLREQLRVATAELDTLGGQPFGAAAARDLADAALGGGWGLPDGLPARATKVITMAGTVARVVDLALDAGDGALTALESARRQTILRSLQRDADHALADATNTACGVLAGWRPA